MPDALDHLVREAGEYLGGAWFCDSTHNVYLTEEQGGTGRNPVINRQERTYVGSVAYDLIPRDSLLNRLYQWDPLKDFVGYVLDKNPFYRFADPFGACSVNVFVEGGKHGWHFDESAFTVTLMLQAPESGGEFEYVPLIRGSGNETGIVRDVLDGDRRQVETLPFTAGTLLIFGGRQTLHRVTQVGGKRPRLVPVICYSESPGMQNSEAVRKLFWGRANPGDPPAGCLKLVPEINPMFIVSISQRQIETFQCDGAICLRRAFPRKWLESLAAGVEKNFENPGPYSTRYTPEGMPGGFYDDYCNWQVIEEYRDFVLNSPAAEIAARMTGSDSVRIYHEHVLVKEPGTGEVTPWHHDLPYWGSRETSCVRSGCRSTRFRQQPARSLLRNPIMAR